MVIDNRFRPMERSRDRYNHNYVVKRLVPYIEFSYHLFNFSMGKILQTYRLEIVIVIVPSLLVPQDLKAQN